MKWVIYPLALCLLVGCFDKRATQDVSGSNAKPTVIGLNFAVSNLAYQLAGDDLQVIYPVPPEVEPKDWSEPAKLASLKNGLDQLGKGCLILISEGDMELPWLPVIATETNSLGKLPYSNATLTPIKTSGLIDEIAAWLKLHSPDAATRIDSRREVLQQKLTPLIERWNSLVNMENKGTVLSLDSEINEYVKTLPIEVTDTSADKLSGGNFVLTSRIIDIPNGIESILINPGTKRSGNSDFITVVEQNVNNLEILTVPTVIKTSVEGYEGKIVPIIEQYCIGCHDTDNEEGEVNFENFLTSVEAESNPDFWDRVYAQLDLGTMPPPEKKKQLSVEEHSVFTGWISELSDRWDRADFGVDPGRTTLRRLNKNEYNYTVRDLFGLNLRPGAHFPEDGGGEAGFDNNADGLFLGALLMENYVEAAGKVAQAVFTTPVARNKFVLARPSTGVSEQQAARKVFNYWASMCYRRPALD